MLTFITAFLCDYSPSLSPNIMLTHLSYSSSRWLGISPHQLMDAGNGHLLLPAVLDAFSAMQQDAKQEGIDLQLVSSYRSFERQCLIWNRKWRGEAKLLDIYGVPLNPERLSNVEKLHAILMWSALPGGSRHHWGSDIDVYDKAAVSQWDGDFQLVETEYAADGPCYPLAQWLNENMAHYGFTLPFAHYCGGVAREPWHLSHADSANLFEKQRNLASLVTAIENSDLEGKSTVLDHIHMIYRRYILNLGE